MTWPYREPGPKGRGGRERTWCARGSGLAALGVGAALLPCSARAIALPTLAGEPTGEQDLTGLVLLILLLFGTFTAVLHLLGRRSWTRREKALTAELAQTQTRLDRANLFLSTDPQIVVAWSTADGEPEIEGDYSLVTDAPLPRRVLGFASWLAPDLALKMDHAVERLRERGEGFSVALASSRGRHFEVEGRAVAGRAVMRIRDVSGDRLQLVRLRESHAEILDELTALRAMLDVVPHPVWTRDAEGRLAWASAAYVRAVEAADSAEVVGRALELFDADARDAAQAARAATGQWRQRAPAVAAGERKMYEVVDVASRNGSAGMASDLSEPMALRAEAERQMSSHARTLDQLSTGVAIFDRAKRLIFYNAAYRQIWSLDPAFLDQQPTDGEVLDRLRAKRQLPEQADFRTWKAQLLEAYQAIESSEYVWYLPDGRTLRAVASPNTQGGVTYLFDDVTQRFALESQFNALTRVQGETLDTLKESVAVFGMDGRLKLINPAFAALWRFDPANAEAKPHIDEMAQFCAPLFEDSSLWGALRAVIVGLPEERRVYEARIERKDGLVLDCAAMPLPDGATLLTFLDVTAGVNVERALKERNQALVSAEKLRNDFVHHVSYELRTPLTNIIGFAQLLVEGVVGELNPKQLEYAGYVTKSSAALLAIINDILDLATIDAGALELRLEEVDVAEAMKAAAEGIQDRLTESAIELRIVATDGVGSLRADGRRVRQILFNLLSNAIGFSAPGQTVTLAAMRRGEEIVFKVSDRGRGIPPEVLDRVFERFETHTGGSRHRGIGVGLSIVRALVELHGGRVLIDSAPNEGTTVTCIFPVAGVAALARAVA
ncbi:MAG: ATP-binding protein [Roseiarcus sp.]|jgi:signal transduction histidine kinase